MEFTFLLVAAALMRLCICTGMIVKENFSSYETTWGNIATMKYRSKVLKAQNTSRFQRNINLADKTFFYFN